MKKLVSLLVLLFALNIHSQSLTVKVLDSISLSPVPYATVYFSNNKGIISDENGIFELITRELKNQDSLFISSMGYKKASFSLNKFNDTIVFLPPKPIFLDDVILTNRNLSSKEIIKKVIENFDKNYEKGITKNKIFLSRKAKGTIEKFNINKFKSSIQEIDNSLLDSISANLSKEENYGLETLCYYFGNDQDENQKINLVKARETYNKGDELLQSLNKRLEESLKKNLKSDSYFKIKSGIFGGD
ncbi:MAG: carboxypeptidase-like regulatory domain-containing protein, partial [Flavobacteriaceae bacterium]|nr:carboxypeptidase-like regulatory domain-containing protein [Flavobacteriaceae bacterium]